MSPTSKSRKRKRRAQLLAGRYVPAGEGPRGFRISDRNSVYAFDDWLLLRCTRRTVRTLLMLSCALVAVLAAVSVNATDDLRTYENAPVCAPIVVETTGAACREQVPVVVTGVGKTENRRNTVYYVDVSGLPQTPARIELRDDSGVWPIVQVGDRATVELWHGTPVAITDSDWTSETRDTPRKSMVTLVSITLVAFTCAAMFALYWMRFRAAGRAGGDDWPYWLVPLEPAATFAPIGFLVGAFVGSSFESLVVTVAVGGAITLLGSAYFVMRWRAETRAFTAAGV